jgi:hypothetical protein
VLWHAARNGDKLNIILSIFTYFATSHMSPTLSWSDSPRPRMPPEHTLMPASRTAAIVSNLSSKLRVEITFSKHVKSRLLGENRRTHAGVKLAGSVEVMVICRQPSNDSMSLEWNAPLNTHASLSCFACSGESIPSVVQTSIPIPLTSLTISRILSKPRLRPAKSLQAAPIQNLVLPFSLAWRAASMTGSKETSLDATVGVE